MKRSKEKEIVSASEIGSWAWCPESWRLSSLGHEPRNKEALKRGDTHHARKAAYEGLSRTAVSLGWWLFAAALLVAALAFVLLRGQ